VFAISLAGCEMNRTYQGRSVFIGQACHGQGRIRYER
jgi:hypothetical protein